MRQTLSFVVAQMKCAWEFIMYLQEKRMKRASKARNGFILAVIVALLGAMVVLSAMVRPRLTDPHAGQVYVFDGYDWVWMTPMEGVPVNAMAEEDFDWSASVPSYLRDGYDVLCGVDVSEHQAEIDWQRVAAAGVDFAYIRVGRRGYSEGGLFEDAYFRRNIEGAKAAGLKVGVYFFSQAVTTAEAIEEANMVLRLVQPYAQDLPIMFDWEKIYNDLTARTTGLDTKTLSDCAVAFCETVKSAGYRAGIYFNRNTGYYGFDLTRMGDYTYWFALPESKFPNFYYRVDLWQYSFSATVPGINTPTDMNLMFVPKA